MKKTGLIYSLMCLLLLSGCMEETHLQESTEVPDNGFILRYSVGPAGSSSRASVPSTTEENVISSMYILFFEPTSTGTGKFIDIYMVELDTDIVNGEFHSIVIDFVKGDKYTALSEANNYNLLIATNAEYYSLANEFEGDRYDLEALRRYFKALLTGRTENEVINATYFRFLDDENVPKTDHLPMSGSTNRVAGESIVEVELTRTICRIDVINKDSRYDLVSASLWNVFPRTTIWGGRFQEYDDEERLNNFVTKTTTDKGGMGRETVLEGFYTFENYVADPAPGDEMTTCVIVGLKDKSPTSNKGVEYFRINVSSEENGQQLKRNYIYRVNINRVLGTGKNNEQSAYEDTELLISGNVNDWNLDESGTVLIDGENIMVLPYSRVNFLPGGGEFESTIFTFGVGTLEVSQRLLPEGITANLVNSNVLHIEADASEYDRQGMVELTFGNLKGTITIVQRGSDTEHLEITPYAIDNFPCVPDNGSPSVDILVTATGISTGGTDTGNEWDAEIVCTNPSLFSFSAESVVSTLSSGDLSDNKFKIYVRESNRGTTPIYGFVMIKLRNNPSYNRVILLTQDTPEGILLDPSGSIIFNATGEVKETGLDTQSIQVTVSNSAEWNVLKVSGDGNFDFTKEGNVIKMEVIEGEGGKHNLTGSDLKSVYRVYLVDDTSRFRDFTVVQESHQLTLNPSGGFGTIPAAGGRTMDIVVTSTGPWSARIADYSGNEPYFVGKDPGEPFEGVSGASFAVAFPELSTPQIEPTTTIEVKIKGTTVSRSIILVQSAVPTRPLNFCGWGTYGNLATPNHSAHTVHHIRQMSDNIRNLNYFGPGGIIDMPGYTFVSKSGLTTANITIPAGTDIYQSNYTHVYPAHANNIRSWLLESHKHIYFCCSDDYILCGNTINTLITAGVLNSGFNVNGALPSNIGSNQIRVLHSDYDVENNALYKYLLQDGPFTNGVKIDKNNIQLVCYDAVNSNLSSWSTSFIPIIMSPNGQNCIFGIDPERQFIFLGDIDLFGNYGSSSVNYSGGTYSQYNMKFLNNVIAWMTNAALYGKEFTSQFKLTP